MSTWYDDLKRTNPAMAADWAIAGLGSLGDLRRMVLALSCLSALNTSEENARLAAAKRILAAARKGKDGKGSSVR